MQRDPPILELPPGRTLLVSDVHLTPREPEVFAAFLRFLEEEAKGARSLLVLGDLFDFWVGPGQARLPAFREAVAKLREVSGAGVSVHFLEGNRDFAFGPEAARQGLGRLPDAAEVRTGGRRVLVTHGDLLCTRDHAYHRMRRIVRSRPVRLLCRTIPLALSLRLAEGFRRTSDAAIRGKTAYEMEPDFGEIRRWLERGADALVFGHVHRGERYRLALEARTADVFVLGAWEDVPSYVAIEADGEIGLHRYGSGIPWEREGRC